MMDSFLTLVGNLTVDPALSRTPAGTPVCRFRIAANERVFDRVAGQWRDGSVLYLPVICWRRLAENVAASLRRGIPSPWWAGCGNGGVTRTEHCRRRWPPRSWPRI